MDPIGSQPSSLIMSNPTQQPIDRFTTKWTDEGDPRALAYAYRTGAQYHTGETKVRINSTTGAFYLQSIGDLDLSAFRKANLASDEENRALNRVDTGVATGSTFVEGKDWASCTRGQQLREIAYRRIVYASRLKAVGLRKEYLERNADQMNQDSGSNIEVQYEAAKVFFDYCEHMDKKLRVLEKLAEENAHEGPDWRSGLAEMEVVRGEMTKLAGWMGITWDDCGGLASAEWV